MSKQIGSKCLNDGAAVAVAIAVAVVGGLYVYANVVHSAFGRPTDHHHITSRKRNNKGDK